MSEPNSETVERVARAHYEARTGKSWALLSEPNQDMERSWAFRALEATV